VQLIVTDTTFCNLRDTGYATVIVHITPDASFLLPDSQNVYYPLTINNTTTNGLTYFWDFDDGQFSYNENPDHQFTQPGLYDICMTTYYDACWDTVCHRLKVFEIPLAIWLPDAFTPNGDGRNDFYAPTGVGVSSMHMVIFNRFGEKIFESNDMNIPWDGTFRGKPAENGVYIVHVTATLLDKTEVDKMGTVTIYK